MKSMNYKPIAALLVLALSTTNALADRFLINDIDQTVSLTRSLDCYSVPQIVIDTSRPEIYGPDPKQLQAIGDTVRAILSYECPNLSRIKIIGYVRGLEDVIYRAELLAQNNWLLPAYDRTPQSTYEYDG
jgi:hypothetical protein